MLKPSSLTNVRINVGNEQAKTAKKNAEDAIFTAAQIVANLSKADVTTESVKTASTAMSDKYYNKFANKSVYEKSLAPEGTDEANILDDASFYITIAKGIPADLSYVQIGDVRKEKKDKLKVSIGNNGFIIAPMWKVDEENNLMVATALICALADVKTGVTDVTVGGITYSIPAIEVTGDPKPLKITNAVINKKEGSKSTVTFTADSATASLDRFDQAIGVTISAGDKAITDTTKMLFVYSEQNQTFAMTPPETWDGVACTYVRYMFPYAARKVDSAEAGQTRTTTTKIVIPGYGVAEFTLTATSIYTE